MAAPVAPGASSAGAVAIVGRHPAGRDHPSPKLSLELGPQELRDHAEVASEHDRRDVEDVDDAGQRHPQRRRSPNHRLLGPFVSGSRPIHEQARRRPGREPGIRKDRVASGIGLQAARRTTPAPGALRVHADVADLARPPVATGHDPAVDDGGTPDATLPGDVDEVGQGRRPPRRDLGHRPSSEVGLVADPHRDPPQRLLPQQRARMDVRPAEVGCEQQPARVHRHDSRQRQARTHEADAARHPSQHGLAQTRQPLQGFARLAVHEVVDVHLLRDDPPPQVDDPRRQVARVHLQPQGSQPATRPEGDRRSARAAHHRWLELCEHTPGHQLIDQPGRRRPGHRRPPGHARTRQRCRRGDDGAGDQAQVAGPQRRLPGSGRACASVRGQDRPPGFG